MNAELPGAEGLDLKLLPVFLAEAGELLPRVRTGLALLSAELGDDDTLHRIRRSLHTLKGTARMTGASQLADAVHGLELQLKSTAAVPDDLTARLAQIEQLLESLKAIASVETDPGMAEQEAEEVTLELIADRMQAVCDRTALAQRKRVHLRLDDNRVFFPRGLLDALTPSLDHLLRNAIAHGIEAPAMRLTAAKPQRGDIVVEAHQSSTGYVILVSDDGQGIDLAAVRAKAAALGLAGLDRGFDLIFEPGFSLAETVDQTAGMGVGLDAVRAVVTELGGGIEVQSEPGRGTRFAIHLPR